MAFLAAAAPYLMYAAAAGTALEAVGSYRSKVSEAHQLKRRAGQTRAQSQRVSNEERRQAELVRSRAVAVAGSSGTAVDSVGLNTIYGDISAEGEYRALTALWNGEEEAIGLEFAARNKKSSAKWGLAAGALKTAGAVSSAASMQGANSGWSAPGSPKAGVYAPDGKKYWGALPN